MTNAGIWSGPVMAMLAQARLKTSTSASNTRRIICAISRETIKQGSQPVGHSQSLPAKRADKFKVEAA